MKIKSYLLVAAALSYSAANAQKIKWGNMEKCTTDSKIEKILGSDAKAAYVLKVIKGEDVTQHDEYTIEKFDFPNMQREYSNRLSFTEDGSAKGPEMYCDGIYFVNDNWVSVIYGHDVKTLYGVKINADGSMNEKVKMGSVYNRYPRKVLADVRYGFCVSKDKASLMGYYVNPNAQNKITLNAWDGNLKEVWSKEVENPFKGKKEVNIIQGHSSNNEAVYVLVSYGKKDKPEGYEILAYNHGTDQLTVDDIKLDGGKFPNLIDFDVDNSGNAMIAGYYADDKSKETVIGSFCVKIDKSGKEMINKTTAFDKNFLGRIISDGQINKGKGIDLVLREVIARDDGSAIISGEQIGGSQGEGDYDDAVIAKINPDGSTGWVKSIAKKQGCQYSREAYDVCSYGLYVSNKNVYVIFNDSKKNGTNTSQAVLDGDNSNLSMQLLAVNAGHPVTVCETIDIASGSVKKEIIEDENVNTMRFFTHLSLQTSPSSVIIYSGDNGKYDKLGELSIP